MTPAHNPDFKGEKMKKKAVKKGTPRAKKPSGRRSAPSKKPFRLEEGKKYSNRQGTIIVRIVRDAGESCFYPYVRIHGEVIKGRRLWNNYGGFWHVSGVYHDPALVKNPHKWRNLVREVQPPKSPKGRGK